ncbi:unnamed protein product [Blumeria hordei]|uniref:Uncharacterized protein n=1 Tax=Blumeria hordei TaxID=2867405 RepID=A0A383V202_BLUHO|nr:unnamed protein product [Blumeria hordei]
MMEIILGYSNPCLPIACLCHHIILAVHSTSHITQSKHSSISYTIFVNHFGRDEKLLAVFKATIFTLF